VKLGTATSVLYQYDIRDAVDLVARLGFDGVDLWGGRPHIYRQDLTQEELKALRHRIAGLGLTVASLMPAFFRYPHSLSNPNPRVRADSIDYMRRCVDNAAVLGAPIVLVVPDHSLHGQTRADSLSRFVESVAEVARYALPYDLKLGLEILYDDETDFLNSADDALAIIAQVGQQNLGVVLDSGTLHLSKEPLDELLTKLGALVLQVHVSDNHGHDEQENLIPGEGTYDFAGLIRTLKAHGYDGYLSAEITKGYAPTAEQALRTTLERLRGWMQANG